MEPEKRILAVFADEGYGGFSAGMTRHVPSINTDLDRAKASVRVVSTFANTGNFVVATSLSDAREVARAFTSATKLRCVAVTLSYLYWCLGRVRKLDPPASEARIRWTSGAAFRAKGRRQYFKKFSSPSGEFECLSTDIVGLQKRNVISAAGRRDPARSPDWRRISEDVARQLGGEWIARSLHSLEGTLISALMHLDRCGFEDSFAGAAARGDLAQPRPRRDKEKSLPGAGVERGEELA